MTRTIDHDEVVRMLTEAAERSGLTLERFFELGRADKLESPRLRDLWLIWGDEVSEDDVRPLTTA